MFDASFEPWIVGDMMTVGLCEELMESQVNDAIDYIRSNYGSCLTLDQMEDALDLHDIDYNELPEYLRDRLDQFNVEQE